MLQNRCRRLVQFALFGLVIAMLWNGVSPAAARDTLDRDVIGQASTTVPVRDPDSPWLVIDETGILEEDPQRDDQADRFQYDLRRLQALDVEAIIYIRQSTDDRDHAQMVADAMLRTWNVESSPGADDGLVILVTLHGSSPRGSSVVLAYGPNTFPIGQMTEAYMLQVYNDDMVPRMRTNDAVGALTWGVRRLVYYAEYTPPFPDPIVGTQATVKTVADALGPAVPQTTVLILLLVPVFAERRLTVWPTRQSLASSAILIAAISVLVGALALFGHSRSGAFGGLIGLAIALVLGLVLLDTAPVRSGRRQLSVSRRTAPTLRLQQRSRGIHG